MRGIRLIPAAALALCALSAPSDARADWRIPVSEPVGVCVDSRGCGGSEPSSSTPYYRGGPVAWGHVTRNGLDQVKACGNKPLCVMFRLPLVLMFGAMMDGPYYAAKGVGYGLYYGGRGLGKGLYYGGRGIGRGVAYTGAAIGRGLAYPFNRPPKPVVPPATWEQYKHDVLKRQKKLAKAGKAAKEQQRWCVKNVPLEASAGRARWEEACNGDGFVSRAALPAAALAAASDPAPAAVPASAGLPDAATPIASAPPPAGTDAPVMAASSENPVETSAAEPATPADSSQPAGSPQADPPKEASDAAESTTQQAVETGVSPGDAGLTAIAPSGGVQPASAPPASDEARWAGIPEAKGVPRGSAPDSRVGWGTPQQIGEMMSGGASPTSPGAGAYLGRAGTFLGEKAVEKSKTAVQNALRAEFGGLEGRIFYNMTLLPEYVLSKVMKAAKGELTLGEVNFLTAGAVNLLYNIDTIPNEVLAMIAEKGDAAKGLFAYGMQKAAQATSGLVKDEAAHGAGDAVSKLHQTLKYGAVAELGPGGVRTNRLAAQRKNAYNLYKDSLVGASAGEDNMNVLYDKGSAK